MKLVHCILNKILLKVIELLSNQLWWCHRFNRGDVNDSDINSMEHHIINSKINDKFQ